MHEPKPAPARKPGRALIVPIDARTPGQRFGCGTDDQFFDLKWAY
jgi:hypothetical protein